MNRNIYIAVVLLLTGASRAAVAQDTNSAAAPAPAPVPAQITLQSLAQKNIFDPGRSPRRVRTPRIRRETVVRSFTFNGTFDDNVAIFTGEGAENGLLKVGSSINGFKVMKIPEDDGDPTVILTDTSGAIVNLREGESMRREDDGPWNKSDQAAPEPVAAPPETKPDDAAATAAPSPEPAGESDILKKLRLKREQEDK
jgi:hypothetical protein